MVSEHKVPGADRSSSTSTLMLLWCLSDMLLEEVHVNQEPDLKVACLRSSSGAAQRSF